MYRTALLATVLFAAAAPLAAAPTTNGAEYVKNAGAGDLFEKTSSQTVLKTTKNPKVRDFANMMIKDHTQSTAEVKAAAKQDGVMAGPPKLMPEQAKMIADLKAASPAQRDKVYLDQQVTAHQMALDLHKTFSQGGDKPALKAAAAKITPVVQQHLTMVQSLDAM